MRGQEPGTKAEGEEKMKENLSRRSFLGASAGFAAAGLSAVANPIAAAAQSVGVNPGDLPDLTIKEVKVYVPDMSNIHKLNGTETGELISVVTNSGIEGNYTRSEEHTSELQSPCNLVCRLLLEKKNKKHKTAYTHHLLSQAAHTT